jgi:formamidopyrimidine-DNA glycosylase
MNDDLTKIIEKVTSKTIRKKKQSIKDYHFSESKTTTFGNSYLIYPLIEMLQNELKNAKK